MISNVFVEPGADDAALDAAYDDAIARIEQMASDGATPIDEPLVAAPGAGEVPPVESSMADRGLPGRGRRGEGVHPLR